MGKMKLEYIIQGVLDNKTKKEISNGLGNWYDAEEFRKNPMAMHKEGTKEALKAVMLYYMCSMAEVQRVIVKIDDDRHVDITVPMLEYIKENDLMSLSNVL